ARGARRARPAEWPRPRWQPRAAWRRRRSSFDSPIRGMSTSSYLGRIESLVARPRWMSATAVAGLILIGALLALLGAAWAAGLTVDRSELDRADARLASEVHGAAAGFSGLVSAADARAGSWAEMPALQRALLRHDRG